MASPRPWIPIALAVSLVALGVAQGLALVAAGPSGDPLRLRLAYEEGEVLRYGADMEMAGTVSSGEVEEEIDLRMRMEARMEVTEVDAQGIATIDVSVETIRATLNGRALPPDETTTPFQESTMRVAPDGTVVEGVGGLTTGMTGPGTVPGAGQFVPLLPDRPVAPGEEWTSVLTQRVAQDGPEITVRVDSEFEGYETVDGVEAAVIAATVEVPMDVTLDLEDLAEAGGQPPPEEPFGPEASVEYSGSAEMDGRTWFDPDRGVQVRAEIDGTIDLEFGFSGLESGTAGGTSPTTRLDVELRMTMELL